MISQLSESVDTTSKIGNMPQKQNKFSNFQNYSTKDVLVKQFVTKRVTDALMEERTNTFMASEDFDQSTLEDALKNADIPEIMKPDSYKLEVVDDEKPLVKDELAKTSLLEESMKEIDFSIPIQIFNSPSTEPLTHIKIRKLK